MSAATTTRKRVLFVDDEPAILAGLQNLLYKDRKRWDMVFALGGEVALDHLRVRPFDVVVSDMRMPGMDGATLLNQIKAESPQTVRIMLSGHADREAIVRALPALHQLLSKPCEAAMLRNAIERSVAGDRSTYHPRIDAVIGMLDKLPTPAHVLLELARVLDSPTATAAEIVGVVVSDPGLSAKLLQLVNSAYFGVGHATSSIEQAVTLLGADRLRYITNTASVFASFDGDLSPGFSLLRLQESSHRTALLARSFVTEEPDAVFAAALLHDVGRAVLAIGLPHEYGAIFTRAHGGRELRELEHAEFGVTHAEVGARLLAMWGLPDLIVDAVRYHHDPGAAPEASRALAAAVHVADSIVGAGEADLDLASLERAGMTSRVAGWNAIAKAWV